MPRAASYPRRSFGICRDFGSSFSSQPSRSSPLTQLGRARSSCFSQTFGLCQDRQLLWNDHCHSRRHRKTPASHFFRLTRATMNETLYFLTQYGSVLLFVVVLVEQVGLPVPALLFLIAAGALVGTGQMALSVAVGSAVLAALLGDQLWYELGRRRGRRVLNWLCRISLEPTSCVHRTEEFFTRHGMRSLVVAKFVPGLSTIT